jgi:hypothetical protein
MRFPYKQLLTFQTASLSSINVSIWGLLLLLLLLLLLFLLLLFFFILYRSW